MRDRLDRNIEYLRLSVTQSCNLNCIYCSAGDEGSTQGTCSRLAPEEFGAIVGHMAKLGIRYVRVTGGEPLTRPDICEIISVISRVDGIEDISMTTNGMNLEAMAKDLKKAGLKRLNISIDSLDSDKFKQITGGGRLDKVLAGVEKALEAGLTPVKLNTVLIKGVNDTEIDGFIGLAKDYPIEVRFIELMPIGAFGEKNRDNVVYNSSIIASRPYLKYYGDSTGNGPATLYRIDGYKGSIGFISPMSHKFCNCCNRIRLTCDGKIKPCLGNNGEVDIIETLRNDPSSLGEAIRAAIYNKPEGHNFKESFESQRNMKMIGG